MKIAHAIGWYFPESRGGTEVYVDALARGLSAHGIRSTVIAPLQGETERRYEHHGVPVFRYPFKGDAFQRWLAENKPDVYHQHTFVPGCDLEHLASAKAAGAKTVVTFHTVGSVCLRGDLRYWGKTVCDGVIEKEKCGACWARHRGWPAPFARAASLLPESWSRWAANKRGRWASWTATSALVLRHAEHLKMIETSSDLLVVTSMWMKRLLMNNRVSPAKVRVCELGTSVIEKALRDPPEASSASVGGPLKIGFLGRWYPLKGIDLLVQAAERLSKELAFELFVYGAVNNEEDQTYAKKIKAAAQGDRRIHFQEPVPPEDVPNVLKLMDLLAIPSRGAETGPLVMLEAFAVGTPVLGSRLGSLAEMIRPGVNGWWVEPDSVESWEKALRTHVSNPALSRSLRGAGDGVRTREAVAKDMAQLYQELFA
jgi:glycosyltransferase involved in cell wall biosynthesis